MPAPVLEAPAKAEEARLDERERGEEPGEATWVPLFGAIAAADPAAHAVTLGADLRTKTDVLLHVQRTAGNQAAKEWIEGPRPAPVTVARSACCEGCAAGESCSIDAEQEVDSGPAVVQRVAQPVQRDLAEDAAGVLARVRSRAATFVAEIRATVSRIAKRVEGLIDDVARRLRRAVTVVLDVLNTMFGDLRRRVQAILVRIRTSVNGAVDRMLQGVLRLSGLVRQGWEALKAGARAFLERIRTVAAGVVDRVKGMGRAAFGPMTGQCLGTPAAEATRARFDGVVGPGETEIGDVATTGLADLTAQFGAWDADGAAHMGGLVASAGAALAQTTQESDGVVTAAESGQVDVATQAGAAVTDIGAEAAREVTGAEGQAASGAGEVDSQRSSGVGGLRGLLGGLVAAVTGAADRIVGGADRDADDAAGGLRGRLRSMLASLRDVVGSVVGGLRAAAGPLIESVKTFARSVVEQAGALWQGLRAAWKQLEERGRAALRQLRQWWRQLVAKATAGWRSLRSFLARTRDRAAAALFNTCGDACALEAAKRDGRQLDAAEVPAMSFKARAGGARRPATGDLVAIQAALEEGGQPLPASTRAPMEAAFGTDLSHTRIHTGATAAGLTSGMNARAFTIGDDIAFGQGEFQPGSIHGDALIAHEVAHVLQQRRAISPGGGHGEAGEAESEHDADHSAISVVARMWGGATNGVADIAANAGPRIQSGLALRRCPSSKCCDPAPAPGSLAPVKATGNTDNPRPTDLMTGRRGDAEGGDVYGQTGPGFVNSLQDLTNTKSSVSEKCNQTCKPNAPGAPTFSLSPFFFVAAGHYEDFDFNPKTGGPGARRFSVAKSGPCKGKSRPRVTVVTDALAGKVKAAEVEHAHDLARAWDLSIAKYIAAVNELKGGFCVDGKEKLTDAACTEEFRTRVGERSGIKWDAWSSVAECLTNTSKDRDDKGWHTVSDKSATKIGTKDCASVEVTPDAGVLTNIGTHGTKEAVDDKAAACGAGGAP